MRGVLGNMYDCVSNYNLDMTDVQVRIGCTGKGRTPHYRIERGWPVDQFADEAYVYGIFNGRNHKTLMEWTTVVKDEHWSEKPSSFEQVRELLGLLRGVQPVQGR